MAEKVIIDLKQKTWRELYKIYKDTPAVEGYEAQDAAIKKDKMKQYLVELGFNDKQATSIVSLAIASYSAIVNNTDDELQIAHSDLKMLSDKLHISKDQLEDKRVAKLLLAFVVYARSNPHPSNWIHYDRKAIFYLAGLNTLRTSRQEQLVSYLHKKYDLNMQVVGSTQPIPCFQLTWLTPASEESGENPLINIGPIAPSTITTIANMIGYNQEDKKTIDK